MRYFTILGEKSLKIYINRSTNKSGYLISPKSVSEEKTSR